MFVVAGNLQQYLVIPYNCTGYTYIKDFTSTGVVRGGFRIDWATNKVGLRALDMTGGATYQSVSIKGIYGIGKVR